MHAALMLTHAHGRCVAMLRLLLEAGGDLAIREEHPVDGEDGWSGRPSRGEDIEAIQVPLATRPRPQGPRDAEAASALELEHETRDLKVELELRRRSSGAIGMRRSSGAEVEQVEHVERMIHMAARVGCGGCLSLLVECGAPVNSR
ncbi:uncharacterized protein LOC108682662, partial [Hyalella azteca]|uniref:Uncharacterized protein LOC108682662 n=1 Tax=Hyalella azteca TaxID=294128 RepID=A0A8B7PME2_HYAAZ